MTQHHPAAADMARVPEWEMIDHVEPLVESEWPAQPVFYISGPMSGYVEHNYEVFHRAKETMLELGYLVDSPADHGYVDGWEWVDYIKRDLDTLVNCQGIVVLPNYRTSPGACIEVIAGRRMGLPILKLDGDQYRGVLRNDGALDYEPDDMDIVLAHGDVATP